VQQPWSHASGAWLLHAFEYDFSISGMILAPALHSDALLPVPCGGCLFLEVKYGVEELVGVQAVAKGSLFVSDQLLVSVLRHQLKAGKCYSNASGCIAQVQVHGACVALWLLVCRVPGSPTFVAMFQV
jgi:hypothetical protein